MIRISAAAVCFLTILFQALSEITWFCLLPIDGSFPVCSEVLPLRSCASGVASYPKSFHEKAGECQVGFFFFLPLGSLRSSRAASVAILPSALFLLSDCRSVPVGRSHFSSAAT